MLVGIHAGRGEYEVQQQKQKTEAELKSRIEKKKEQKFLGIMTVNSNNGFGDMIPSVVRKN